MNFDKRFNASMSKLLNWSKAPKAPGNAVEPGVDADAREVIVALQAQVEAMQRGMATIHGWIIADKGGKMRGSQLDQMLTKATDIRAPEFPQDVLAEAARQDSERTSLEPLSKSPRKARKPAQAQSSSLEEWFDKIEAAIGVRFNHADVLYRHVRFEKPKIIFLPNSDSDHQKVINWMHAKILDCAFQYGTEEGTEQHWACLPAWALADHGLAVPNPSMLTAG